MASCLLGHQSLEVCPSLLTRRKLGIRAASCLLGFGFCQPHSCAPLHLSLARLALAGEDDGGEWPLLSSSLGMDALASRLGRAPGFNVQWEQLPI